MVAAVLVCGALFSLYHQNPAQTIYQFCCGMVFALLALRSGSIFPAMLSHFINNAAIVLYYHFTGNDTMPLPWYVTVIAAVCLVGTLVYLLFFDKKKDKTVAIKEEKADVKGFVLFAVLGIVVCLVNWVSGLLPPM
jgi:membrane protease YdiL (CAAX protease family)